MDDPGQREPADIAEVLTGIADLRRGLDRLEHDVVHLIRATGATWEDIGENLGISRQAARRRFERVRRRRG